MYYDVIDLITNGYDGFTLSDSVGRSSAVSVEGGQWLQTRACWNIEFIANGYCRRS